MTDRPDLQGVIYGLPIADYFMAHGASNSLLSDMAKSPAHCYALNFAEDRPARKTSTAMDAGSLAHCAVLEPGEFGARYVVLPEDAPKKPTDAQINAAKPSPQTVQLLEWWAAFNLNTAGRIVITAEQHATALKQRAAVTGIQDLADILHKGDAEVSFFWTDSVTGRKCKGRADFVHPLPDGRVILLDLKTTQDASPRGFARSVAEYGYHRQAAWYSNGYEQASGKEVAAFIFAAVTSAYPIIAAPYMLDDESLAQGAEECAELLELYAQCRRTNTWPAFGDTPQLIGLPGWARRSMEVEISHV